MSASAEAGQEEKKTVEKHRGWPKGRKRKPYTKEKDGNAPRRPVNGYVRFMQDKRESVAAQNPTLTFAEVTKILGNQWTSLPQDEKQKYLDDAESDRAEYLQKLKTYNKNKQNKESDGGGFSRSSPLERKQSTTPPANPEDIPIFTEAFLDHNKAKDTEFRQLRKSNAEYAEQNTYLQRHINNLQAAITKLDGETQAQRQSTFKLQMKLNGMKELIVKLFKDLPLPESELLPTVKNAENYMKQVYQILQNSAEEHKEFSAAVQEIMLKLNKSDLQPLIGGH